MEVCIRRILAGSTFLIVLVSACTATAPSPADEPAEIMPATASASPTALALAATEPVGPKILWSFQTEGAIWGSPAINAGVVYIGSDDGNLYALDVVSGSLKWTFPTGGLVRSQPAIADGTLYFTSDDGYLYAIGTGNGQQVWRTDIGNFSEPDKRENPGTSTDPTGFDYLQASPVVSEDRVYVGSADGSVYALAADTGRILWSFKTGQKVGATPAIDSRTIYIGSWDGTLYALDATGGETRWKTPIGGQIQSTAVAAGDFVYAASRKASVVALDARTGQKRWELEFGRNQWVESSPLLMGDRIYIGSSGNQYVRALDGQLGEVLSAYKGDAFFWSTPALAGHSLYIGGEVYTKTQQVGGLLSLDVPSDASFTNRAPMKLKWLLPIPGTLMPDGNWSGVASSPLINEGVIYFGGLDGKLYAVRIDSLRAFVMSSENLCGSRDSRRRLRPWQLS